MRLPAIGPAVSYQTAMALTGSMDLPRCGAGDLYRHAVGLLVITVYSIRFDISDLWIVTDINKCNGYAVAF